MNEARLNSRCGLVAAVFVGALASVLSPTPGQAAGTFPGFLCKVDLVAVFPGKFVSVHCVPGDEHLRGLRSALPIPILVAC